MLVTVTTFSINLVTMGYFDCYKLSRRPTRLTVSDMSPSPRVELTFPALFSSRMEVIAVSAGDMVVAVVSGLLVTKEPEVDAEDFIIN